MKSIVLQILCLISLSAIGQNITTEKVEDETKKMVIENDSTKVFVVVEHQAEFPGGMGAFYNYILGTLNFPKDARKDKVNGKVFVQFIIEKDGSIQDSTIQVIKSLYQSCDAEAIRIISKSPNWVPAKHHGKPVRSKFVLPVTFNAQ